MAIMGSGPMLNAYPDSLGGRLENAVRFLSIPELKDCFQSFYILPSLFNSDLDRGFSVIDYGLNESVAQRDDLNYLKLMGIDLKLDFVLNHLSVQSPQFQDILSYGHASRYIDFFINWNRFWDGYGWMTDGGYIQPDPEMLTNMFFRKPGLPFLMVHLPDGEEVPFWNTFYQKILYTGESVSGYLGQMDLDIKSPLVWEFYEETLRILADYGASIVRLDAFAYAPKAPGKRNFLNSPETWDLLQKIRQIADRYNLNILPEIHSRYCEEIHTLITEKGYTTYDFYLPGLILDALDCKDPSILIRWIHEIRTKGMRTVNMLGCHDGIPLLDLEGLLPIERIDTLVQMLVERGGYVKELHGQKDIYYQVNTTYYSALGESDDLLLLARALQLFIPGKPQVWYLDLFAGKNDLEAVDKAGPGGHKEINRTNLDWEMIQEGLGRPVVRKQLEMLRFRNMFPAFGFDADLEIFNDQFGTLGLQWTLNGYRARLDADLVAGSFSVEAFDQEGRPVFSMMN